MSKRRVDRLGDLLKEEMARILTFEGKDPRLSMCNVTRVILSNDYHHARVLVSVMGTPKEREDCIKALKSASGFIRHGLARLDLRHIPELSFHLDTGAEYSQHIEELLQSIKKDETPE